MEAGIFPRVRFWRFSQNRPPTRVSRTLQNRGLDLHQDGGIAEKTSFRRKNLGRRMRSLYRGCCRPTGLTGPAYRFDRSRWYKYSFTCVRSSAAFVLCPLILCFPRPPPLCSSFSVHLFMVDLNVVCVRTLVDLIGKGGPNLSCPLGGLNQSISSFCALFDEISISFLVHLIARSP